jgi:thiamine-phosphate pyrophosphorylase
LRLSHDVDESALRSGINQLGSSTQARNIAFLIEDRIELALSVGADGVHLSNASGYSAARRRLGSDGIIGATCTTRHDAIVVAEAGADYVAFGSFDEDAPTAATLALVEWWSPLMTVPCVVGPCATLDDRAALANAGADLVAVLPQLPSGGSA